jgi:hypothetical protein
MPVIGRSSGASFDQVLQVPMDRANGHCALSGGAGHTLDRAVAHVARGEYARQAGLERQRRTLQWPRRPVKVAAGTRTDRPPRFRTHSTRKEPEIIRPSAQQAQLEKDAVPHASNRPCRPRRRPRSAIQPAPISAGSSANSPRWDEPISYARCWTAGWRSTRVSGATSPRWTKRRCTVGRTPYGCSCSGADVHDRAFDADGPTPWTVPCGARATTEPKTATTPARWRRCSGPAHQRGPHPRPETQPSTRFSPGTQRGPAGTPSCG